MKTLVVDDYATMRRIVRNLLSQSGYPDIDEAGDGVGALMKLRESKFDLVISDWNMDPMNGLQLLKEIRADAKLAHLPFIAVFAGDFGQEALNAVKQAGNSSYVVKPFNSETLRLAVEALLPKPEPVPQRASRIVKFLSGLHGMDSYPAPSADPEAVIDLSTGIIYREEPGQKGELLNMQTSDGKRSLVQTAKAVDMLLLRHARDESERSGRSVKECFEQISDQYRRQTA